MEQAVQYARADEEVARAVRVAVVSGFTSAGHAPSFREIADRLALAPADVVAALEHLDRTGRVVLGAQRDWIRAAAPFSSIPTPLWVETPMGSWWGNSALEALGIVACVGGEGRVRTTSGGGPRRLEIDVREGRVIDSGAVAHVAVDPRYWPHDPIFASSTALFFAHPDEIAGWSRRHRLGTGAVLRLPEAWAVAYAWFSEALGPAWRAPTLDEARAALRPAGLLPPDASPLRLEVEA